MNDQVKLSPLEIIEAARIKLEENVAKQQAALQEKQDKAMSKVVENQINVNKKLNAEISAKASHATKWQKSTTKIEELKIAAEKAAADVAEVVAFKGQDFVDALYDAVAKPAAPVGQVELTVKEQNV